MLPSLRDGELNCLQDKVMIYDRWGKLRGMVKDMITLVLGYHCRRLDLRREISEMKNKRGRKKSRMELLAHNPKNWGKNSTQ